MARRHGLRFGGVLVVAVAQAEEVVEVAGLRALWSLRRAWC
jgi:hypothetical protein